MAVKTSEITLRTKGSLDMIDITCEVEEIVRKSGIRNGIAVVFIPGATGAIVTIENEEGLVEDFKNVLSQIIPQRHGYLHDRIDNNAVSHLRATFLGSERSFPVVNDSLLRGTWQNIFFVELDVRPRNRKIVVQVTGE
ncbi:MAG: YjbQ family protein [Thermotogaceae bacterium]|nr:YjbQ family protein [Thermotogaceae bacterium]